MPLTQDELDEITGAITAGFSSIDTSAIEQAISAGFQSFSTSGAAGAAGAAGGTAGGGASGGTGSGSPAPAPVPAPSTPSPVSLAPGSTVSIEESALSALAGIVTGGIRTGKAAIDASVAIQETGAAQLARNLRRQAGISVREGESLTQAVNRITNTGSRAFGVAAAAYERNILEFQKFEGLKNGEAARMMNDLLVEFGELNQNLLAHADEALQVNSILFANSMGMQSDEVAKLIATAYAKTGEASTDILDEIANQAEVVGDAVGIPFRVMGEGIKQIMTDMEMFTNATAASAARITASLSQMGLSLEGFSGMLQPFRDFDSAAEKMGDLSALFGVQIDAMEMMYLANEDEEEFLHRMREELINQGVDVENMSATRQRALANTLGMQVRDMRNFMMTGNREISDLESLRVATQEASSRSGEDAQKAIQDHMAEVASTTSELQRVQQEVMGLAQMGSIREFSEQLGEAQMNTMRATTQSDLYVQSLGKLNTTLSTLSVEAMKGLNEILVVPAAEAIDASNNEFTRAVGDFTVEADRTMRQIGPTIGTAAEEGLVEGGAMPRSFPRMLRYLAAALGNNDHGNSQMPYYIEKIEEFSTTISGRVRTAMLKISESFDTDVLAENFSIANSIVTEGTQSTIDSINSLSDQVPTSTVVVSPEINQTITAETTAIRDIHERTIQMIEEIVEKFEKEPTEVKVEFNLEDLKEPLIKAIAEGFENSDYQFNLKINEYQFAEILQRSKDVFGTGIQLRSN